MGFVQSGKVIHDGANLALQGARPSGMAAQGKVMWRKAAPGMPWALLASTSIIAPAQISEAIDTRGAQLLVAVAVYISTAPSFDFLDSEGNEWTLGATLENTATSLRTSMYFCTHPHTAAAHTFSDVGTSLYATCFIQALRGPAQIVFTQATTNHNNNTSLNYNQLPALTPPSANSLLVTGVGINNAILGIDSGFTLTGNRAFWNGVNFGGAMAYLAQETASPIAPRWSFPLTAFVYSAAILLSFTPT